MYYLKHSVDNETVRMRTHTHLQVYIPIGMLDTDEDVYSSPDSPWTNNSISVILTLNPTE